MRERVTGSVPFVAFHVERILERADRSATPRGRTARWPSCARCSSALPASVLRDELVRRVAGRLDLSDQLAASLLGEGGPPARAPVAPGPGSASAPAGPPVATLVLDRRERGERTFLALCIAFPREGAEALARLDPEQHLTGDLSRRAAAHLAVAAHLERPLDDLPQDDPELATLVSELDSRAARGAGITVQSLEHAWLALEMARLDRAIDAARATQSGEVATLSAERQQVRTRYVDLSGRLQGA